MPPARPRRPARLLPAGGALLLALVAARVDAQSVADPGTRECVAALPPSAFVRVPVSLRVSSADERLRHALPRLDGFAERAAARVSAALGGRTDSLPSADQALDWRNVGGHLHVTVRRDGSTSWMRADHTPTDDSLHAPALALVERALQASAHAGELPGWPRGADGDSLTFDLGYAIPEIPRSLRPGRTSGREGTPAFTHMMPWLEPVAVRRQGKQEYPPLALQAGVTADVALRFVIDTLGRPEPTSFELVERYGPPLTGEEALYHGDFVLAATQAARGARYRPASVGGCLVRQLVQQQFRFRFGR